MKYCAFKKQKTILKCEEKTKTTIHIKISAALAMTQVEKKPEQGSLCRIK